MAHLEEESFEALCELLGEKARENPFPLYCTFELTYKCNLRCQHCYLAPMEQYFKQKDLSTQEVFSLLEQLKEMGSLQMTFTGGEIFMRRDIFDIIGKAKSLGFHITLYSNATMMTEEVTDRLAELLPISVEISLYGMKKETYESVTQIEGAFERFFKGIRLAKEKGIQIKLKMPIMTLNQSDFEAARFFAYELGVPFQYDPFITPRWNGSKEPLRLRLSPKEAMQIRTDHLRLMKQEGKKVRFWTDMACDRGEELFSCACGRSSTVIDPQGWMRLCSDIPEPKADARSMGVKAAWERMVEAVHTMKPTSDFECPTCPVRNFCIRNPGLAFIETGALDKCIPFHKEVAEELAKEAAKEMARALAP